MPVHNHGTEDGPGLACNETRQPDGSLVGACLPWGPHEVIKPGAPITEQNMYSIDISSIQQGEN